MTRLEMVKKKTDGLQCIVLLKGKVWGGYVCCQSKERKKASSSFHSGRKSGEAGKKKNAKKSEVEVRNPLVSGPTGERETSGKETGPRRSKALCAEV